MFLVENQNIEIVSKRDNELLDSLSRFMNQNIYSTTIIRNEQTCLEAWRLLKTNSWRQPWQVLGVLGYVLKKYFRIFLFPPEKCRTDFKRVTVYAKLIVSSTFSGVDRRGRCFARKPPNRSQEVIFTDDHLATSIRLTGSCTGDGRDGFGTRQKTLLRLKLKRFRLAVLSVIRVDVLHRIASVQMGSGPSKKWRRRRQIWFSSRRGFNWSGRSRVIYI